MCYILEKYNESVFGDIRINQTKFGNTDKICYWNVKHLYILKESIEFNPLGFQIVLIIKAMIQSNNSISGNSNSYINETMEQFMDVYVILDTQESVINETLFQLSSQFTVSRSNNGIRHSTILTMSHLKATIINKLKGSNYDNTDISLPVKNSLCVISITNTKAQNEYIIMLPQEPTASLYIAIIKGIYYKNIVATYYGDSNLILSSSTTIINNIHTSCTVTTINQTEKVVINLNFIHLPDSTIVRTNTPRDRTFDMANKQITIYENSLRLSRSLSGICSLVQTGQVILSPIYISDSEFLCNMPDSLGIGEYTIQVDVFNGSYTCRNEQNILILRLTNTLNVVIQDNSGDSRNYVVNSHILINILMLILEDKITIMYVGIVYSISELIVCVGGLFTVCTQYGGSIGNILY